MKATHFFAIACLFSIAGTVWGQAPKSDRFTAQTGAVKDAKTGLEWTQSDNGTDINWNEATAYCSNKGPGWKLPSNDDLLNIYDKSASVSCNASNPCRTSPLFQLSGHIFWTNELNASSQAWLFVLTMGIRDPSSVEFRFGARALCVRRP